MEVWVLWFDNGGETEILRVYFDRQRGVEDLDLVTCCMEEGEDEKYHLDDSWAYGQPEPPE